jgi:hypothetical protein
LAEFAPHRRERGGIFDGLRGRLGLRRVFSAESPQFKRLAQRLLNARIRTEKNSLMKTNRF